MGSRIDDLVERYETAPDTFAFRNRGQARIRGLEAELQAGLPLRGLGLELSAHAVDGEALDDGSPLDTIPVDTFTARLRREWSPSYAWVGGRLYGKLDEPGPTEQRRDGHGVVDAGAGVHLGPRVELDLVGRNLVDLWVDGERDRLTAFLAEVAATRGRVVGPIEVVVETGDRRSILECVGSNLMDDPAIAGLALNFRDVSERKVLEEQLRKLAFHDPPFVKRCVFADTEMLDSKFHRR